MLKIYPTLVLPGTGLYELWRRGAYEPLTTEAVVDIVAAAKALVPPWVRIQRVQREIGVPEVAAGLDVGNVRELARARLAAEGRRCRCIRCREVGMLRRAFAPDEVTLHRQEYSASAGSEVFLSLEVGGGDLVGYARLRRGSGAAYLRELKVLGTVVSIGGEPAAEWQHRGFGASLLEECEATARDWGFKALLVTSGVGVRGYYRRHAEGHGRTASMEGPYVSTPLL